MRVLHLQKVTGIAGSERHLLELLPALASRGVEVRMCVLGAGEYGPFVHALRDRGVEVQVLPAGSDVNPPLVGKIARLIREFKPNVIHTHLIHADVYGQIAARLARVPGVSSVHSTNAFYRREPYLSAARIAGHLARRTIAVSEHVGRFVEDLRLARRRTIRVIHYGINVAEWVLPEVARVATRASLDLRTNDIAVGVASRLFPNKGHDFLLEALQTALPEAPHLRLLVAGDGPLRSDLQLRAERVEPTVAVRFLGHIHDMPSFMNACDVVAFPSLLGFGEGFGLAALEAMAAGRPVIATSVDSLVEIVLDGETGCLVEPGSVKELAQTLLTLARDEALRRQLGARGHERARTKFSVDAMLKRTIAVYQEIVAA